MSWITQTESGVALRVKVVPRASRNEIKGVTEDALLLRIQSPPVDGKANKAVAKFVAKCLQIPASDVELVAGDKSRVKRLHARGVTLKEAREALIGAAEA